MLLRKNSFRFGHLYKFREKYIVLRKSIPRQIDKKSGVPGRDRGLEFLRRRKGEISFFLYIP